MKTTGRALFSSVLAALLLLTFALPVFAASSTQTEGGVIYRIEGGKATLDKWDGKTELKELTIPETVGGAKVTAISANAFKGNATLEKVKGTANVTDIGQSAFSGCSKLSEVTGFDNVTALGASAFENSGLTQLPTFTGKLKGIPNRAFSGCTKLTGALNLAETETVGVAAFYGSGITSVQLDKATTVAAQAFEGCIAVSTLAAPVLEEVGATAFMGCAALGGSIDTTAFPNLKKIGQSAFSKTQLTEVKSDTITFIDMAAFSNCPELAAVELEAAADKANLIIGDRAFKDCTKLATVKLPDTLKTIGGNAFSGTLVDPNSCPGGIGSAMPIIFDGTKADWDKISGTAGYASYNLRWEKGTGTSTSETSPVTNNWNPNVVGWENPNVWIGFREEVYNSKTGQYDLKEIVAPKSGQKLVLWAQADYGTISFMVSVSKPSGTVFRIEHNKMTLDSSKPGIGTGMKQCRIPVTVEGRSGDTFVVTISGTYMYGGQAYPINTELNFTMRSPLQISPSPLQNVVAGESTMLQASWGPPSAIGNPVYEWSCKKSAGTDVTTSVLSPATGASVTFTPKEKGRYTITCKAKSEVANSEGVPIEDTKSITVDVLGLSSTTDPDGNTTPAEKLTPVISDSGQLTNMQPGESTSLRVTWPDGTPAAEQFTYAWTCTENQTALRGATNASSVTFTPPAEGKYTISCAVTIKVKTADPSTWIVRTPTIEADVKKYTLAVQDESGNSEAVLQRKDTRKLIAKWAPADPQPQSSTKYTWSCSRNGSNVTTEVLAVQGNEATFTAAYSGDYVVSCTATAGTDGGRVIRRVATFRIKVGYGLTLEADNGLSDGSRITTGTEVTVRAKAEGGTPDAYKWRISGAKWDPESATDSVSFTAENAGTVSVSCTVGSGAEAASASMKFTVVNGILKIDATNEDGSKLEDGGIVRPEERVQLEASMESPSDAQVAAYAWSTPKGAVVTPDANKVVTFSAVDEGVYVVSCTARDENRKEIAKQSIKIRVKKESASVPKEPTLKIACSLPVSRPDGVNDELRVSSETPFTLTAVWENGTPSDSGAPAWNIWKIPAEMDDNNNEVDFAKNLFGDTPGNSLSFSGKSLAPGEYKVVCSRGEKGSQLSIQVFDSPVLQMTAWLVSTNLNDEPDEPEEVREPIVSAGTVDHDSFIRVELTADWMPTVTPNGDEWYTWTCSSSYDGNVTDAVLEVDQSNRQRCTLKEVKAGETYTVTCKASGRNLPTEVVSARTATFTVVVSPKEEPENIGEDTNEPGSTEQTAAANNASIDVLSSSLNTMKTLGLKSTSTGVCLTGLTAAGSAQDAVTVGDLTDCFDVAAGQSVAVVDRYGQEKTDGSARVATGDSVRILDENQETLAEATVVVMGDMLGTGEMNLSQLVTMAKGLKDEAVLTGPYMEAGDWDNSNNINLSDLVKQAGMLKASRSV